MTLKERAAAKLAAGNRNIETAGMTKLTTAEITGKPVTVTDYDFLTKDGSTFALVTFREWPNCFYFAGQMLTDLLFDIEADKESSAELRTFGLAVQLDTVKGKKRDYTAVKLV